MIDFICLCEGERRREVRREGEREERGRKVGGREDRGREEAS